MMPRRATRHLIRLLLIPLLLLLGSGPAGAWHCADGSLCERSTVLTCCCGCPDGAAASEHEWAEIERSAAMLAEDGFPVSLLDAPALAKELATSAYHGGLFDPEALALHPVGLCELILEQAEVVVEALAVGVLAAVAHLERQQAHVELKPDLVPALGDDVAEPHRADGQPGAVVGPRVGETGS